MKKTSIIFLVLGVLVLAVVVYLVMTAQDDGAANTNTVENTVNTNTGTTAENANTHSNVNASETSTTNTSTPATFSFLTPKKSAHYETNTPAHASILPAAPVNVVIDFNFDLAPPSSISIMKDGVEYGTGATTIDDGKLGLRRTLPSDMPDGLYDVTYNACWPDGSCHDGAFQFAIDSGADAAYLDKRNTTAVTIDLANLTITPAYIRIARNTTVTWTNNDEFAHYVNTDSHPAHTYFPSQNSRELLTGDSYAVTFTEPGFYPYHCSAHPEEMVGGIIVE